LNTNSETNNNDLKTESVDNASEILCKRVNELRKKSRLTLEQLSVASGVSRSMLSQIERGQANPTLAVTFRIAQAFNISIGELVDLALPSNPIEVVHGDVISNVFRSDDECQIRTLSPLHLENDIEFYELRISPNSKLDSAPHYEGTKELLTIVSGSAIVICGDTKRNLSKGDSAHYRADLKHSIENGGNSELHCYLVVSNKH